MGLYQDLAAHMQTLRALREQKQRELDHLDETIASTQTVLDGLPEAATARKMAGEITGRFRGKSIPEAAQELLTEKGEPMVNTDIARQLLQGGITTTSRRFETTVYAVMRESGRFKRTPDGKAWWIKGVKLPSDAWGVEYEETDPARRGATPKVLIEQLQQARQLASGGRPRKLKDMAEERPEPVDA